MINFLFLGKPASGKGTQSELLSSSKNIPLITAGKLLREYSNKESGIAQQVRESMDQGNLIPDGLVMWVIKDVLDAIDFSNGVIFDGIPRNVDQAHEFDKTLNEFEQPDYIVFDIDISDEEVVKRITGRRVCSQNQQHIFHMLFKPPQQDGVCDVCGGALKQRDDDSEENARHRLSVYYEETHKLVDFYKEKGILYAVDGERNIDEIQQDIIAIVDRLRS